MQNSIYRRVLKSRVLRLYRECMKSAAKCPQYEHQMMMKSYIQLKFDEHRQLAHIPTIEKLITSGLEEVERMEYYHSMYAMSQQEKLMKSEKTSSETAFQLHSTNDTNRVAPKSEMFIVEQLEVTCANCRTHFVEAARFCSHCGTKRATLKAASRTHRN